VEPVSIWNDGMMNRMKHAANDTLFMADLNETMHSFSRVDGEWWEHET